VLCYFFFFAVFFFAAFFFLAIIGYLHKGNRKTSLVVRAIDSQPTANRYVKEVNK